MEHPSNFLPNNREVDLPHRDFTRADLVGLSANQMCDLFLWLQEAQNREWELARTDPLTGVHNRLAWEEDLKKPTVSEERRQGITDTATFCFVDVDDLHNINNQRGYSVGDAILRQVAATLVTSSREFDKVYRIGGDEFVVWFHWLDPNHVTEVFLRLHQAVDRALATLQAQASLGMADSKDEAAKLMRQMKNEHKNTTDRSR